MTIHFQRYTHHALLTLLACLIALAQAQVTLEGRTLSRAGDTPWSRTFPVQLGPIVGPLTQDDRTWLAVGPALYAYKPDGTVATRIDLPTDAAALDASGGELSVTVRYGAVPETFAVTDDHVRERVVYPPLPATTTWLYRAATTNLNFDPLKPADATAAVSTLQARLKHDPTNPFTHAFLAVAARKARQHELADRALEEALAQPAPFFVMVRLARFLDAAGLADAADRALLNARISYADLGYDPSLPVSRKALHAYGDPLGYLQELLKQNKTVRAEAWIRYLRDVSPRFHGYRAVYARYASTLEAQNRIGEAFEWRAFSRELGTGSLYNLGPDALLAVRDVARWATVSLVLAITALWLTLGARAWPAQTADLSLIGGRYRSWLQHPLSRTRRLLISYWGFGEKLVLVTLFGALLVALGAWTWSSRTYTRAHADVLNFGTYGGAWFYEGLETLGLDVASRDARLLRGLAAQLDQDDATARTHYANATGSACARNNIGVLQQTRGDEITARDTYRSALALEPNLTAPAYNLQLNPSGFEAAFQRQYRSGPRLCYPDQRAVYNAVDGVLSGELQQIVRNPWVYLTRFPSGLPRPAQWLWVGLLLFLFAVSVFWLLVPRPASARTARHSWLYRLFALLFPGGAFLDIAWGLVLLLAWATAVTGLMGSAGWLRYPYLLDPSTPAATAALTATIVAVYALNALLLLMDEVRYARRTRPARATQGPSRST